MFRIVTAGSVPPSLGGETIGGVASFHANLLTQYAAGNRFGIDVTAVFAGNLGQSGPFHPLLRNVGIDHRSEERVFVEAARKADAVFIFHVSHRFGTYWERNEGMPPLVARVPSWTGLGSETPEKVAILRRRLQRAKSVVLACDQLLEEGVRCGYLMPDNAHVIPSALDSSLLAPTSDGQARPKVVVFVGRLDDNKGPIPLLHALKRLPEWSAIIVGSGPLDEAVREVRDENGLAERVQLRGAITDRVVLRGILDEASVLCVPSRREAFGTVYAEAMARGTFAVGLDLCIAEINQTLGLTGGIGVASQDPEEIAAAIETAHRLQTGRPQLAQLAQGRYSAERCAEALARVFLPQLGSSA